MLFGLGIIAWMLCPFVLIPFVIHLKNVNDRLTKENKILKGETALEGRVSNVRQDNIPNQPKTSETTDNRVMPAAEAPDMPAMDGINEGPQQLTSPAQVTNSVNPPVPAAYIQNTANVDRVVTRKKKYTSTQLMFSVGVLCILIAGLIFATTNWAIMPVFMKISLLFLAVFVFMGLSFFFERKIGLHETSIALYSLGSIFLPLTVIAIGYFKWINNWFSFSGGGRFILGCTCFVFLTLAFCIGKLFYGYKVFDIFSYISSSAAVIMLVKQIVGKGDLVMLVSVILLFGTFLFLERGAFKGEVRKDGLTITAALVCAALFVIAIFANIASGYSVVIAIVYVIAHISLVCIALLFSWPLIYYFVPLFGSILVLNVAHIFKDMLPYGDFAVNIVLFAMIAIAYRHVKIAGKNVLLTVVPDILLFVEMFGITIYSLIAFRVFKGAEGEEMTYMLVAFAIATVLFISEYVHSIRKLSNEKVSIFDTLHLAFAAITGFVTSYGFVFGFTSVESGYMLSLIPTGIFTTGFLVAGVMNYRYRLAGVKSYKLRFSEVLLEILAHIALLVSVIGFMDSDMVNYLANIPLIIAIVLIQVLLVVRSDNREGIVTALMAPFTLLYGIADCIDVLSDEGYMVNINTTFELEMMLFFAVFIIGLIIYKKLIDIRKEENVYLFDFNLVILICMLISIAGEYMDRVEHGHIRILIGLAYILFYVSRKVTGKLRKLCYSGLSAVFVLCMCTQDFFVVKDLFITEWRLLTFLIVTYVNLILLYKDEIADPETIMYVLCVISIVIQVVSAMVSEELFDVIVLSVALLIMVIAGYIKKSKRWFLFGIITLVFVIFYVTKDFWTSIAWWVYLLIAGCVFITLAATNEYRKQKGGAKAMINEFFEDWNR